MNFSGEVRWFLVLLLTQAALLGGAVRLAGQVRVVLDVTEKTGGIFESNFRTALSAASNVRVVGTGEAADVGLRVVVVCTGANCQTTPSYAVSVVLTRPLSSDFLLGLDQFPGVHISIADSSRAAVDALLRTMATVQHIWSAQWGRARYEQAVREFVAQLDTQCFESVRIEKRIFGDPRDLAPGELEILKRRRMAGPWMC